MTPSAKPVFMVVRLSETMEVFYHLKREVALVFNPAREFVPAAVTVYQVKEGALTPLGPLDKVALGDVAGEYRRVRGWYLVYLTAAA
jgi:hypothetical protein